MTKIFVYDSMDSEINEAGNVFVLLYFCMCIGKQFSIRNLALINNFIGIFLWNFVFSKCR